MTAEPIIIDAMSTIGDRYVPRYEVYFAKEPLPADGKTKVPPPASKTPLDADAAMRGEKARLEAKIYKASGDPASPPPKVGQLLPLMGPWGDKPGQSTNDVLSVEFTESVDKKQPLSKVKIELHNVYDFETKQYRYTDVLQEQPEGKPGPFPLLEYGDTIALRFGYEDELEWVFDGIITTLEASYPADGQGKLTVTAVDRREKLRCKKKMKANKASGATEEATAASIAAEVGLHVAAPAGQKTAPTKKKGSVPSDQDALQFLTDRANQAALELVCFGETLFLYAPGDVASTALQYDYRAGLMSFTPTLNNAGKPTSVRVISRDPTTGQKYDVTVTPETVQEMGLAPPAEKGETETDQVKKKGGEKPEVVTTYLARSVEEARQIAVGIMKRNMDLSITVAGDSVGDPRIRVRSTLKIGGVGRFNGFYYVTESTHKFGSGGYQTSFKARRNTALGTPGAKTPEQPAGGAAS